MDLSRAWLMETAGWKAVKEGNQLYEAGGVSDVSIKGALVKGKVKIGRKTQIAGLKIHSTTEVDNLCRCRESLRDGTICCHSVAVALAADHGQKRPSEKVDTKDTGQESAKNSRASLIQNENESNNDLLTIKLESVFTDLWEKDKFPIRLINQATSEYPDKVYHQQQSNRIKQWLRSQCQSSKPDLPPFLVLNRRQASELLKLAAVYPYFSIDKQDAALSINEQPIRLKLQLEKNNLADNIHMRLTGFADGNQILLKQEDSDATPWIYSCDRQKIWPVRLPEIPSSRATAYDLLMTGGQGMEVSEAWLASVVAEWSDVFEIEAGQDFHLPSLIPGRPEFELHLEGSLHHVSATICAFYEDYQLIPGQEINGESDSFFPYESSNPTQANSRKCYFTRNIQAEKTALNELTSAGFTSADQRGVLHLRGQNEVLHFHVSLVARLRNKWRSVKFSEKYRTATSHIQAIRPIVAFQQSSQGEDWFSCSFEHDASGNRSSIPENEIRRFLATGQNQLRQNSDGTVDVLDRDACEDWFEVLRDCNLQQESGGFRIPSAQRDYVESSLACYQQDSLAIDPPNEQQGLSEHDFTAGLGQLNDILRPYQREGIAWLYRKLLPENGGGALLADEMGLGKTLQTLAVSKLLKSRPENRERENMPVLVVCPTSLIDNWEQEIRKFTPEYKTLLMRGPKRAGHFKNLRFADVVITSYALLIRDIDQYQEQVFRLVVLDEASYIRNPKTRNSRSVKKLNADSRLALTGTPVENSVLDIWSISDFVRPGYLGSREEFKERYEKPINSGKAPVQLHQRFRRRLNPMILRRTKRKVATDLPDKLEEIVYCNLTDSQKAYYAAILRESRNKINKAFSGGDERGARANMLTALLRLRQICCDERLIKSSAKQALANEGKSRQKRSDSAKMTLLREMLQESIEGGHRVLIFSQFVSMLKLIRDELNQADFFEGEIAYLDGSSQDRAAQVERFQSDPEIKVFLISLKAGGYGLNLTAADTVMHFDPWWNPAVEAQATDRAHRIGQDKIVTSYKFIARDTVEEKILKLQQRKRDVFDAAIDDDSPLMRGLNTDDLREILEV